MEQNGQGSADNALRTASTRAKSPVLTQLEKLVYDRCLETGYTAEEVLQDRVLAQRVLESLREDVRTERVQDKLNLHAGWLRDRLDFERSCVRRPEHEPQEDSCTQAAQAGAQTVDRVLSALPGAKPVQEQLDELSHQRMRTGADGSSV